MVFKSISKSHGPSLFAAAAAITAVAGLIGSVRADSFYVSNSGANTISSVSSSGVISTYVSGLATPWDMTAGANGSPNYVINAGNNSIESITAGSASTLVTFPSGGSTTPQAITLDGSGNIYTVLLNGIIDKVTPSGSYTQFANLTSATQSDGLAFNNGNLYVSNYATNNISEITPGGTVSTFATLPSGSSPSGIAFDGSGNLYVANFDSNNIDKINASGVVSTFASFGSGTGSSGIGPNFLTFDQAGNLFVTGYYSNTIDQITPGGLVSTAVTLPSGDNPAGIIAAVPVPGAEPLFVAGLLLMGLVLKRRSRA